MPGQPVVLDSFGGIVTTARPEDLPEGASPRNNDVDFVVGRFIQRPGCQSVYTHIQSEYGPNGGSVATDIGTTSAPWSNSSNILLNNESYATVSLAGPAVANYYVQSVSITQGGYYSLSQTPQATVSGVGSGAIVELSVETITPPVGPPYQVVIAATVIAGGIYSNIPTVTFSGASIGNDAVGTITSQVSASVLALSDVVQISNFGFSVPSTYQINGIGVNVRGFALSGGTIFVQLVKNGSSQTRRLIILIRATQLNIG